MKKSGPQGLRNSWTGEARSNCTWSMRRTQARLVKGGVGSADRGQETGLQELQLCGALFRNFAPDV
jgi:hypothetical protein